MTSKCHPALGPWSDSPLTPENKRW